MALEVRKSTAMRKLRLGKVCMCVWMSMCAHTCLCVVPQERFPCFMSRYLTGNWACGWGGVGQWELGALLFPSPQLWGHKHKLPHPVFDVGAGRWTEVLVISWQAVSNWDIALGLRPKSLNDLLDIIWQSDDIQAIRSWAYPKRKISQIFSFKASVAWVYSCWFQNWVSGVWASLLYQLPSVTVTNTWEK